jgi:hypothetical protein
MAWRGSFFACAAAAAALAAAPSAHAADKVRITGLSDVAFGLIAGTGDRSISQSVCAFSDSSTRRYSVVATGSGSGGAFELSGAAPLPYEVLWADSPGQTGGSSLIAGTAVSGFTSTASHQFCNSGPPASASLTIVIRAAELASARSGAYSGTLQLMIAPE